MNLIEVKNLTVSYQNSRKKETVRALNNFSINFKKNAITTLVGQIGCGKTTLIRAILGVLPYDSGTILYNGENIDKTYIEDRSFAYVSQNIFLYPRKTIFDNLAFPLLEMKMKKDDIRNKVYEIAEKYDVHYLLTRKPNQLSIGQVQKISLIKALIRDPEVLFLDEPFSNLDLQTTLEIRKIVKEYVKNNNKTCILVTHNINDALYLSDEIAVMDNGELVKQGEPKLIFASEEKLISEIFHAGEINEDK